MSRAEPLDHLSFLSSYDDDGQADYVQAIVRVLAADHQFVAGEDGPAGWRISRADESDGAAVSVAIKAGYVQKLVNEGILEKVDSDDDYARYRLDVPGDELVSEVRAAAEYLDADHRNLFKDLPYW